jgi:Xaa-Pro aminopeptidase
MEKAPAREIEQRISNFQADLQKQGLDGAFILQNVDIFYFTGTIQTSILFIPAEDDPILMVQKSLQRARLESPLKKILPLKNRSKAPQILKDIGVNSLKKVGLEIDVLPAYLYLWFKENFAQASLVDVSNTIRRLRMIKSFYEIEQIKKAGAILHKGLIEIAGFIREGMTELEIDGHLGYIARKEGHMGILRMRGWNQEMTYVHVLSGENGAMTSFLDSPQGGEGTTPAMAQGAGFRRIRRDEAIEIDYGAGVNGYLSDQSRTYVIGELPPELEAAHECSKNILIRLSKEAKPGVLCSDLYKIAVDEATAHGYKDVFMGYGEEQAKFVGHGLGLEIDEYPILTPHFKEALAEKMVMAIEPKFVFPGKGVVGLEDVYEVTSSGLKRLTLTDQAIIKIKT